MRKLDTGQCDHCAKQFGYYLILSGFDDSSYAYCSGCGATAQLSLYDKRMPKVIQDCPPYREICVELERYIRPCNCGGTFKKGNSPRCPHRKQPLSAEAAAKYIEKNAHKEGLDLAEELARHLLHRYREQARQR
jgi:hypothetical protein